MTDASENAEKANLAQGTEGPQGNEVTQGPEGAPGDQAANVESSAAPAGASEGGNKAIAERMQEIAAGERRSLIMAWLWFGPIVLLGLLQYYLGWRAQNLSPVEPIISAPFIEAPAGSEDEAINALMWKASQPFLITALCVALVLLLSWLGVRYLGWRRMRVVFTSVWCAACFAGGAVMVSRYVNRVGQTMLPPVVTTVIAALPYPSNDYGPGGALTWLKPPSEINPDGVPWRVHLTGADFTRMPVGTRVTVQRARGALWGVFMTGSDAPQAKTPSDGAPGGAANKEGDPS